ncbi:17-beta-hydroxysteroid dehydrogenase type 2 [Diretmus argenteus]
MATAACIYTAVWKVKEGYDTGYWALALGALGCSVYLWGSPGGCGVLLCCSLGLHYVTLGRRVKWLSVHGRAVLVTGCDTGFGHAVVKLLSDMGVTVFAGVLDVDGPGAQVLREHGSKHLQVLQLDVTDECQIEEAQRYIRAQVGETGKIQIIYSVGSHCTHLSTGEPMPDYSSEQSEADTILFSAYVVLRESGYSGPVVIDVADTDAYVTAAVISQDLPGLWAVVNNAGILCYTAEGEIQPITAYRRCMDVNFLSTVRMCQVFLPLLRRSRGRVVNISSMAGELPIPMFSPYAASKAALSIFSRVMRLELAGWGVKVAIIQPAGFKTNIFRSEEEQSRCQEEILQGLSPEAREDYGDVYISSLQSSLSKMVAQMSEDLHPVLEDMRHAVMSVDPKRLYTPGQTGWLLPFLYRVCPTALSDIILTRLFTFGDCRPAGFRMER